MLLGSSPRLAKLVMANLAVIFLLMEVIVCGLRFGVDGLRMDYYLMTCPFAEQIVQNSVNRALESDPTLAAALIRMHFHDCFIEVRMHTQHTALFLYRFIVFSLFFKILKKKKKKKIYVLNFLFAGVTDFF